MAYIIQTAESVEKYIHGIEGLSEEAKVQIVEGYLRDLGENADHFLERYPLAHESYSFSYEYALIDGGLIYSFRFIAEGSHREAGIVQIIYVNHKTMPVPPPDRRTARATRPCTAAHGRFGVSKYVMLR